MCPTQSNARPRRKSVSGVGSYTIQMLLSQKMDVLNIGWTLHNIFYSLPSLRKDSWTKVKWSAVVWLICVCARVCVCVCTQTDCKRWEGLKLGAQQMYKPRKMSKHDLPLPSNRHIILFDYPPPNRAVVCSPGLPHHIYFLLFVFVFFIEYQAAMWLFRQTI